MLFNVDKATLVLLGIYVNSFYSISEQTMVRLQTAVVDKFCSSAIFGPLQVNSDVFFEFAICYLVNSLLRH